MAVGIAPDHEAVAREWDALFRAQGGVLRDPERCHLPASPLKKALLATFQLGPRLRFAKAAERPESVAGLASQTEYAGTPSCRPGRMRKIWHITSLKLPCAPS